MMNERTEEIKQNIISLHIRLEVEETKLELLVKEKEGRGLRQRSYV